MGGLIGGFLEKNFQEGVLEDRNEKERKNERDKLGKNSAN